MIEKMPSGNPTDTREDTRKAKRLEAEASFQDSRVLNEGEEARANSLYLASGAKGAYDQVLNPLRDAPVVIVGCSTGGVREVARLGNRTIGVDISSAAIDHQNRRIKEGLQHLASAHLMDANLDLPPASVGVIACSGVLHHLDIEAAGMRERSLLLLTGLDRILFKILSLVRYFAWTSFVRCEGVRKAGLP